jgi:hypothetical protein
VAASPEAFKKLKEILEGTPDGPGTTDIIWDAAIDVTVIDDVAYDIVGDIMNEEGKIKAFAAVLNERRYQDEKWGGPEHDDTETEENWQKYITEYANAQGRSESYDFRKRMVKIAALALAAIESVDRKAGPEIEIRNVVNPADIEEYHGKATV